VPHLQTAVVPAPGQVVVRLTGEADVSTTPRLTTALQQAAAVGHGAVVVDVAGVRFRDCSGLQALAAFTDALVPAGRRCRIVGAPAPTRRLVRSAGLGDRIELDGPVDEVAPRPAAPLPAPRTTFPARRAGQPYQARPARRAEDRPLRRQVRPGTLRRWR
jgi:anti-anti-sigma factor